MCPTKGHDVEQRLAKLETLCKQKEEERVELELRLTEVKENLKKSLARGALGPPTDTKISNKVGSRALLYLCSSVSYQASGHLMETLNYCKTWMSDIWPLVCALLLFRHRALKWRRFTMRPSPLTLQQSSVNAHQLSMPPPRGMSCRRQR